VYRRVVTVTTPGVGVELASKTQIRFASLAALDGPGAVQLNSRAMLLYHRINVDVA